MSAQHAYDFERFEVQKQETLKPNLKVSVSPKKQETSKVFNIKMVTYVAMFVSVVTLIIYNQVLVTELTAQINSASRQLAELESQEKILKAQLESTLSLRNIEDRVTQELGLSKADDYQVQYVSLSQGDAIAILEEPELGVADRMMNKSVDFLEYIGVRS